MSLNHNIARKNHDSGAKSMGFFSDLFAALTFVFLFLYVVSLLQSSSIGQAAKQEVVAMEEKYSQQFAEVNDNFESRLKSYEQRTQALLEGKEGKDVSKFDKQLEKAIEQAELEREMIVSTQQQEVRKQQTFLQKASRKLESLQSLKAMVNDLRKSNLVAQQQLQEYKQKLERQKKTEVQKIERAKTEAIQKIITKKNAEAQEIQQKLTQKLKSLHKSQLQNVTSSHQQELEKLQKNHRASIKSLTQEYEGAIRSKEAEIKGVKGQITSKENLIADLQQKQQELGQALREGRASADKYKEMSEGLQKSLADAKKQGKTLKNDLAGLEQEKGQLEGALGEAKNRAGELQNKVGQLKEDLEKAQSELAARREVAQKLKEAFRKNKIPAEVDPVTAEVTIPFTNTYFKFGTYELTGDMKSVLKRVFPVFAKTVFSHTKLLKRISNLEFTGSASPIYKGKIIKNTDTSDFGREGLEFNLDLSYKRAKGIFNYVFNPDNFKFSYQRKMLAITRVSSLSHIPSKLEKRTNAPKKSTGWLSKGRKLCRIYNCKQWQKVSIRFNFDK